MTESTKAPITRFGNRVRGREPVLVGAAGGGPTLGVLVGLGTKTSLDQEVAKVSFAEEHGVSTVTDLTTSRDDSLLHELLANADMAVGTVPTYVLGPIAAGRGSASAAQTLLSSIERQLQSGVDFLSIHASLTVGLAERLRSTNRTIPVTSRGGAIVLQAMSSSSSENPYRLVFDELLAMCAEYRVVLSFVGTLRPGSVVDAFEELHMEELNEVSELAQRANTAGVATMVELINHVPLSSIDPYVRLGRSLFPYSSLGALGPTPTDIAVGLDDVAGAIGAATAARAGIDWINVVTAGEHSHLPSFEETARAIRYFKLATHIASVSEGQDSRDRRLSKARACNDWSTMATLALDSELAQDLYAEHGNRQGAACSMCMATCPLVRYQRLVERVDRPSTRTLSLVPAQSES